MKNLVGIAYLSILFLVLSCSRPYMGELTQINRDDFIHLDFEDETLVENAEVYYENEGIDKELALAHLVKTYGVDLYEDTTGMIRKVVVRSRTYQDDIRQILMENKDYDPNNNIPTTAIKCDSLEFIISYLYGIRPEEIPALAGGDTLDVFSFQRAIMQSIWESCGELSLELHGARSVRGFWSMIQHNDREIRAHYYSYIEKLVANGELHPEKLALLTDRLLMNYGYEQVYGSQMLNFRLYPIRNKDSVDIRRAAIELEPLSEYLKRFDLNE
ncbi:MAG: hypothetical protein KTR30_26220 [Saprospiraceae bacterium]|nr:hypothetical protein [Saprospiraceae bacterium]